MSKTGSLEGFQRNSMTASNESFLAEIYGDGATIDEFAASLPEGARIYDAGAGLSTFGTEVAQRNRGIHWTNADINYGRSDHVSHPLVRAAIDAAPPNVRYVQSDVLQLPGDESGSYHRVYSYNLVTHLTRIDRGLGRQAIWGMVGLLDPNTDSRLHIGPTNAKMASNERWAATTLTPNATEEDVEGALDLLTSSRAANVYYRASYRSGVGIYPASRFSPEAKGGVVLSDNGGETYHRLLSKEGAKLGGRLVLGLF